ncbi:SIS domain-containing protein [Phototrophicus methaneseepsis]|uniref:SIS domain-containing protein n=1 Tax=Phototrophicus methaneseepsis TaxID=2710758 RepID=A0A7S8EAJ3_9CHLR|nr:SIS domain-containing protein [Phototrophicus methaneseepsis]QPC83381.1 SIS domain-containing protein [Phototrophicus methaneseepsis]
MPASYTQKEIATQLDAWNNALQTLHQQQGAIQDFWQGNPYDYIIFTGCGSTHYLSLTAANLMQTKLGVLSRAVPASELLLNPGSVYIEGKRPLLITISRSAETTETVLAARDFQKRYGDHIVAITCYDNRPLNDLASLVLVAPAGQEESVAQTRSFSSMLVLVEGMINILSGAPIESVTYALTHDAIENLHAFASPYSNPEKFNQYFYLGSGPQFGIASEAMLKMKEMSLTHAEAYHPLEFRHGPMSMVDEQTLVVGLFGENDYQAGKEVLIQMAGLGATTLCIAPHAEADYRINLEHSTPHMVQYMPLIQWLAFSRAAQKNLNPDQPRNLASVVHLQDGVSLG